MRVSSSSQTYVCLPCLLRSGPSPASILPTQYDRSMRASRRNASILVAEPVRSNTPKRKYGVQQTRTAQSMSNTTSSEPVKLNQAQMGKIGTINALRARLQKGLESGTETGTDSRGIPIEKLLGSIKESTNPAQMPLIQTIEQVYAGQPFSQVSDELEKINKYRRPSSGAVDNGGERQILDKLGILNQENNSGTPGEPGSDDKKEKAEARREARIARRVLLKAKATPKQKIPLLVKKTLSKHAPPPEPKSLVRPERRTTPPRRAHGSKVPVVGMAVQPPETARDLDGSKIQLSPVENEEPPQVPRLSFDLSRVLFNPGVYHLQDPRSRVYNFDPYLEKIMPVSEFNFDALNPYITSSQDRLLREISMKHQKRYIGSSSSMSGVMSHFHFLLSAWRPIDPSILSQKIDGLKSFTQITRAPASIYLRWRDGVYAIDADKEYDTPNVLMMQGKSMEKLLTLEKEEFEKYRKPKAGEQAPAIDSDPEQYHYSTVEDFLLRSQLDAYDPRLPGSGMFDLKTRAVAGIRMIMSEPEVGMNYQIKDRFGMWESFDREYYDMIRSAFLKYSLQVRFGRMDGIFVAYHNIARIFGFQYVSLPELDMALHGQADGTLGDQEFKLTLKLMNEILDQATKQYPEQSMKIMFYTREPTQNEPNGSMRIYAEPMTEEQINKTQSSGKKRIDEYERKITAGEGLTRTTQSAVGKQEEQEETSQTLEQKMSPSTLESNAADEAFLDEVLSTPIKMEAESVAPKEEDTKISAWSLDIYNQVNGVSVARPTDISTYDTWVVKYKLEPMLDHTKNKALYNSTKTRRSAALVWDLEAKKFNAFTDKLRVLSQEGKGWREKQDELDAQRKQVVLYGREQEAS